MFKLKKKYIAEGDFTFKSGYKAAEILINKNENISSIFAFNDQMAIGAIKYCINNNMKVPDQISIIGFDDIEAAKFANPSLSTVYQSGTKLGIEIMNILLKKINGSQETKSNVFIPHDLIIRESSK
jgi:DNA-binding LacI/PurR family transcriptional regulator